VAILDQVSADTVAFQDIQASKVHQSISKALWPVQRHCHPLGTIPMMRTLSIQMAIYIFGLAHCGTMLVK